jgi:hypothetical protein
VALGTEDGLPGVGGTALGDPLGISDGSGVVHAASPAAPAAAPS